MTKHTSPMEVSALYNVEVRKGQTDVVYLVNYLRGYQDLSEVEGNLALFNAAPDLAESVRCILHHIKFCGENDCDEWELAVAKLEQALTKAGIPIPNPDDHSEEK